MKTNIFKYVFFSILIALIGISIYILYRDSNQKNIDIEVKKIEFDIIEELNIGIVEYDDINPILSNNRDIQYIDKLLFQSLLDITYDFKIENLLAEEFSKIDSITYITKLKENVYWHDGEKFTAEDVIFTVENLKKDSINSIYKENVSVIDKIKKIDDYTIKIVLKEETPFFEYRMCFPILASHSYENDTLNSKTKIPIGTGQYKIKHMEDDLIEIIISDNSRECKITKINIILKEKIRDLYNALTKNEIDYMITDNTEYQEYIGTMGYKINQLYNREYEYLVLNNKNSILSDKEIRKVINNAINRKTINYNIYNNKYIVCDFPLDYGSFFYEQEKTEKYSISQINQTLIENGWNYQNNRWRRNNKKLEFNLIVNENNKRSLLANEIKKQLEEIGIIINVVNVNNYKYNNYIKNKNYDMILTGNIISNSHNLESYFGEENLSNFDNIEVKKILNDVKNIEDEEIIKNKYLELIEIYKQENPFVSLYYNSLFVLSNTNLKGDLSGNWYNLFYNIDSWYKIK